MSDIAVRVLARMPAPVGEVCGPISNGGVGSIKGNLDVFRHTIYALSEAGHTIFDQMPFEEYVHRLISDEYNAGTKHDLLEGFYAPLFEAENMQKLYFIPGWESSNGARWERKRGEQLGLEIIDLSA